MTVARLERLELIAGYYLKGHTLRQICELVQKSLAQVHRDLRHIRGVWQEKFSANLYDLINRELARLDAIEQEAWIAWRRSQQARTERAKDVTSSPDGVTTKRSQKKKQPDGEAAFLQIAMNCVDRRIKLFEFIAKKDGGEADDVVIKAVEVIVNTREEAQAMLEFEDFRRIVKQ